MPTPFKSIADTSATVAGTRSRKKKIAALRQALDSADRQELPTVAAWLTGLLPQGRIGVGPKILREAAAVPAAPTPALSVADVNDQIDRLARIGGKGALQRRRELLATLMGALTADEQTFLTRLLLGELRQGALEGVMIEAVAAAADVAGGEVRRAVMVCGDIAAVAGAALDSASAGLEQFRLRVGTPLQPMLAQTAASVHEALDAFGVAAFDYKLDGARVQVHRQDDEVRVFTRQLNEVTARLPEIVDEVRALQGRRFILDGEVIALRDDRRPHPFQVTMRRFGRQLDIEAMRTELPLTVFFFDMLYRDEDLTVRSAGRRFAAMQESIPSRLIVPRLVTDDPAAADAHLHCALAAGHEGVMAKALDSGYEAGSRGAGWLKIKPAHTLDLVVLAAEWGSGRRTGKLSNLHLGARDPDTGGFVMLGKTFKGLTDQMLEWQTRRLLELETHREDYVVHVAPELVVEIAFNELQRSRQYPGGLALRFARVKTFREDKSAAEADTIETVRRIFAQKFGAD